MNKFDWRAFHKKMPHNDNYIIFQFLNEEFERLYDAWQNNKENSDLVHAMDYLNDQILRIMALQKPLPDDDEYPF